MKIIISLKYNPLSKRVKKIRKQTILQKESYKNLPKKMKGIKSRFSHSHQSFLRTFQDFLKLYAAMLHNSAPQIADKTKYKIVKNQFKFLYRTNCNRCAQLYDCV